MRLFYSLVLLVVWALPTMAQGYRIVSEKKSPPRSGTGIDNEASGLRKAAAPPVGGAEYMPLRISMDRTQQFCPDGQCPGGVCPINDKAWGQQQGAGRLPQQQASDVPAWIVAASVKVVITEQMTVRTPRGQESKVGLSIGSGTCVQNDGSYGVVITNSHVVSGGKPDGPQSSGAVTVEFPGQSPQQGRIIKRDTEHDLAAILITTTSATPFVPLAKDSAPAGSQVWQVGYPGGEGPVKRKASVKGYVVGQDQAGRSQCNFMPGFTIYEGDSGSGVFSCGDGCLCGVMWGQQCQEGPKMIRLQPQQHGPPVPGASMAVPFAYVQAFMADVNILSPNRRQPQQQAPPAQPYAPQPQQPFQQPPAPQWPAPPSAPLQPDTGIAAQVQQHAQQLNSHAGIISKLQQDVQDLLGKHGATAGGLVSLESKMAKAVNDATAIAGAIPNLEAKLKALEGNPLIAKVPQLESSIEKVVAVLEKTQPVLAQVGVLQQAVSDNRQAVKDTQQSAAAAHQEAQNAQQQAQAAHAKFPAIEAAVNGFKDSAGVLGLFGPWGLLGAAGVGLGAGAVAFRKNRLSPADQPAQPMQIMTPSSPGVGNGQILAAMAPLFQRVEANLMNGAISGIAQMHAGVPGSMGAAAKG
jgi:hypothetical protein